MGSSRTNIAPVSDAESALVSATRWDSPPLRVREDRSSAVYGGNKVRTLEAMYGQAQASGARTMWATGAYGSNHAVATVMHAPAAGMRAGAILFPQPHSRPARDNLSALLAARPAVEQLGTIALLPFAMRKVRRDPRAYVMTPGGATPGVIT